MTDGVTTLSSLGQVIPIQITVETESKKDKKKEDAGNSNPFKYVYYGIEGLVHYEMLNRCELSLAGFCSSTPVYRSTYVVSFLAGAAFGLYSGSMRKKDSIESTGLENRAAAFAKGSVAEKVGSILSVLGQGPGLMTFAESYVLASCSKGNLTGGNLVAAYWGLSLGKELSQFALNNFKSLIKA